MRRSRRPTSEDIKKFIHQLWREEKSEHTLEKYQRDAQNFLNFCGERPVSKKLALNYKEELKKTYKTASINSMLVAMNRFLEFIGCGDCKVHTLKIQRRIFCEEREELTKSEYRRLLSAAKRTCNSQLYLLLQTICSTGIRVSELQYITVEAVRHGQAVVECKRKRRIILLPQKLQTALQQYIQKHGLRRGAVFLGRNGKSLNRTLIWRWMKQLCRSAQVDAAKVFPHNLRHLFARTFYAAQRDIARLADILGHSNIETTRVYILASARECFGQISRLGLL